jgi:hypothetical protein
VKEGEEDRKEERINTRTTQQGTIGQTNTTYEHARERLPTPKNKRLK